MTTTPTRHRGLPVAVGMITAIALLFRLAFFLHHQGQGWQLENDPALYQALADGFKHGVFSMFHPLDIPETTRMPGYPFLIHVIASIPGLLLLQVLLSSIKIPLVHLLGRSMGLKGRMALLPPCLMAFEPMDIILSGNLLTEALFTTLLIGGLIFLARGQGPRFLLMAALLFAAAAYLRPNGLHIGLLAAFLLLFRDRRSLGQSALFVAALIVPMLPWMWRNHQLDGRFHLSDSGAVVAAHLHVPEVLSQAGDPRAAGHREHLHQLAVSMNWSDRHEMRAYFEQIQGEVTGVIREHPTAWALIQLKKAGMILAAPGRGHIARHFQGPSFWSPLLLSVSGIFSLIAVACLLVTLSQLRYAAWIHVVLLAVVLFLLFSNAISTTDARFKNPVLPLLLLLGTWAVQKWMLRSSPAALRRWVDQSR